jgi:hypothetical protein
VAGLPPALAQRLAPAPGDHLDHIHGCRRQELLEVRPREANVLTLAEIKASDPLREAALHTCPQGILGFEYRRLLALPRGLNRLVVGLRPNRELARSRLGRGAPLAGWTPTTGRSVETDATDRIARHVASRPPVDTGMALGTVRLLRVPIKDTGLESIALAGLTWPARGPKGWPDDIDLMQSLGGDQEVRIHIAAVESVRAREPITLGKVVVNGGTHDTIRRGGRRREHLGDGGFRISPRKGIFPRSRVDLSLGRIELSSLNLL